MGDCEPVGGRQVGIVAGSVDQGETVPAMSGEVRATRGCIDRDVTDNEFGSVKEIDMGHVLRDLGIDRLPIEQRVTLVQEIWDSIAREVGLLPPTADEKQEIEGRMSEDDASPANVATWDEIKGDAVERWKK